MTKIEIYDSETAFGYRQYVTDKQKEFKMELNIMGKSFEISYTITQEIKLDYKYLWKSHYTIAGWKAWVSKFIRVFIIYIIWGMWKKIFTMIELAQDDEILYWLRICCIICGVLFFWGEEIALLLPWLIAKFNCGGKSLSKGKKVQMTFSDSKMKIRYKDVTYQSSYQNACEMEDVFIIYGGMFRIEKSQLSSEEIDMIRKRLGKKLVLKNKSKGVLKK